MNQSSVSTDHGDPEGSGAVDVSQVDLKKIETSNESTTSSRFSSFLSSNPYFSAGFGLMGVGAGLALARQGLVRGSTLAKRRLLVTLEIPSRDKSYLWFLHWMAGQQSRRSHHLAVETMYKQHDNGSATTKFFLVPGPGRHLFRWRGAWIQVKNIDSVFETVKLTNN